MVVGFRANLVLIRHKHEGDLSMSDKAENGKGGNVFDNVLKCAKIAFWILAGLALVVFVISVFGGSGRSTNNMDVLLILAGCALGLGVLIMMSRVGKWMVICATVLLLAFGLSVNGTKDIKFGVPVAVENAALVEQSVEAELKKFGFTYQDVLLFAGREGSFWLNQFGLIHPDFWPEMGKIRLSEFGYNECVEQSVVASFAWRNEDYPEGRYRRQDIRLILWSDCTLGSYVGPESPDVFDSDDVKSVAKGVDLKLAVGFGSMPVPVRLWVDYHNDRKIVLSDSRTGEKIVSFFPEQGQVGKVEDLLALEPFFRRQ